MSNRKTKTSRQVDTGQKKPRQISRELALLTLSRLNSSADKLEKHDLSKLLLEAIRTIKSEVEETLENAASEVQRGNDQLLQAETRANSLESAKAMVKDALELTQQAINRLGAALDLPQLLFFSDDRGVVREYALELIGTVARNRQRIEELIQEVLVDWQFARLAKIDRDILKIAVAEMWILKVDERAAINEAVELAKTYSDKEGAAFINGVLRRVSDRLKAQIIK
jgi:N utilization substance protein B